MNAVGKSLLSAKKRAVEAGSRAGFRVSSSSLWTDPVWRLDTMTPGRRNRIVWEFELHDGSRTTDACHAVLLESFKETFWGMLHDGLWYGKTIHVGSSGTFSVAMRELFTWMVWKGYKSFGAFDSEVQALYLDDLPALILDRGGFYSGSASIPAAEYEYFTSEGADPKQSDDLNPSGDVLDTDDADPGDVDSGDEDEKLTFGQAYVRLTVVYFLYAQGPVLRQAGLEAMPDAPFHGEKLTAQCSAVAKDVRTIIPPLPDEVALSLLQTVLVWLDQRAEELLALQDRYFALKSRLERERHPVRQAKAKLRDLLLEHRFYGSDSASGPWHPVLGKFAAREFRHLLMGLRDACVLALEYFVGMRVSEICSIKTGAPRDDGLPACIETRMSKSGLMQLFFVNGLVSKGKKVPLQTQWLVGSRPVDSQEMPPAVRALVLLERLFAPWRKESHFDALIGAFANPHSLPWRSNVSSALSLTLLKGKRRFIADWVDLSSLPDYNERGEHTAIYRDSRGSCIRSHHGRKTFAAYVLETRSSLLVAVSRHFKHLNTAITESQYYPPISRLRKETESARAAATVEFFVEVLGGRKVYGRMAELVYKYFGSFEWSEIKSKIEAFRKVEQLVKVHGIQLFFSAHGNCLIKLNPMESRCRSVETEASWLNDTPEYSARSPGLCSGCACNLMDASHLPFWRARVGSHFDDSVATKHEFRVHVARREQAIKVVRALEGVDV